MDPNDVPNFESNTEPSEAAGGMNEEHEHNATQSKQLQVKPPQKKVNKQRRTHATNPQPEQMVVLKCGGVNFLGSIPPALGDLPDVLYPDPMAHGNRW